MDFEVTDEQLAFADLARQIFADGASHEQLRSLEASGGPRFDTKLWQQLADQGLLGIAIPEAYGGAGLTFFELALLIEQVGIAAAPVPLLESLVLGAMPIERFGSQTQKQRLLGGVASGSIILTAALVEELADPFDPQTVAKATENGYEITGRKICVPYGVIAHKVIVPAAIGGDEIALFVVDSDARGVTVEALETTSGQPDATLTFRDVAVAGEARLGEPAQGRKMLEWIRERATAALCCLSLGVCEEALRLTAEYTRSREQFGSPIATFQAVGQRQADAYVDTEAVRLTAWQAASRIAAGMPAADQVAVAKYWASFGGQRVVHTAVHQHGGMGVDRDYPLHRQFLYAKQLELSLGGSTAQLRQLGKMLAQGLID